MAKKANNPVPEGMYTITPQLVFNGNCREAIEYYKKAFNATLIGNIAESPDGKTVWHAMMKIGNSHVMMGDAMPNMYEKGPESTTTVSLWLYVEDCDKWYNQAVNAGGEAMMPPMDAFWGDRMGKLKDPFGHTWDVASHIWDYTPEEIQKNQDEFLATMKQ